MPIRTGDRVTLSINPTIRYQRFDAFKPFASISREILEDDNISETLTDMASELRRLLYAALLMEVDVTNQSFGMLGDSGKIAEDTETLTAYLMQEIKHEPQIKIEPRAKKRAEAKTGDQAHRTIRRVVAKQPGAH